ncbi:DJ-1/PfpI family protein [Pyxidicoccus fallax]|uniref:DJ-1/PfpI family protein n=1 Tax=Pyxidicoccus fallax TaxID=394095 RepID=A0A848LXM6_9BACT|nr:DJ-1/PfpI family protein [Pyxidicoccus fallax]NMO22877.1 DJ-1/PfpI family protein [Pyxidicoccus fallax]NPC86311.1 DJ-1/PfpI family protein [Pyxidicoccus fallax]
MTRIGIVLFDGAEELDYAGPWEVFAAAAYLRPELSIDVKTFAHDGKPIRSAKGLRVLPDGALTDAPRLDVLLAPGGEGRKREMHDERMLAWLRAKGAEAKWVTSVCTGAFLLQAAGLCTGRRVTTHWSAIHELRERGNVTVLDDIRYVRDGNVVTAAGVSAGIDMALWLVGQLWDPAFARQVQRYIQYEPAPPYGAEV